MSAACDLEVLEELAFDELPLEQARRALEHASGCPDCRGELAALRRERSLFHARAAAQPALPRLELFARVEGQARDRARRQRVRREVAAFALCAASLLCVVGLSSRSAGADFSARLSASAGGPGVCLPSPDDPGGRRYGGCSVASVDEIGRLEADFGACLVATPAHCR
ncbi:MAG TPA: hypothetical protein VND93_18300 [Myxococcales bacterium]|nr:hypothetical protein [Myxococcales bacterium]